MLVNPCSANLGCNWALEGLNVVYPTFELSEALVSMRIDSMLTDIPTKEIFKDLDGVEMKVKLIGKKAGNFKSNTWQVVKMQMMLEVTLKNMKLKQTAK